jgi:hypothetical protein
MLIKLFSTLTFTILCCTILNAQNSLVGKTYKALISESCKKTTNGGFMEYTYLFLKFKKDSVLVSYDIRRSNSTKERENRNQNLSKTYKWTIKEVIITIENFSDYNKLSLQGSRLIGEKPTETEIFYEEPK